MLCIYCQIRPALTADHVPPKLLFARPYPANLVTVPSCRECNGSFQHDDEYFRSRLIMRADLADNPHAEPVLQRAMRGLQKPEARGFTDSIVRSLTKRDVLSAGGILLGQAPAYEVDNARLEKTLCRIVRGLFFHKTESALPPEVNMRAHVTFDEDDAMRTDARNMLRGQPIHAIGSTFRYAWVQAPDVNCTAWILEFFERVPFFVVTIDPRLLVGQGS